MENLGMKTRMTAIRASNPSSAGVYGQPVALLSRQNWIS